MAKKLWGTIRALLYMVKRGLSKNIPWREIHMMLKRSTKMTGKAIRKLLLKHQTLSSALTCCPNNICATFISPREYEFSFSDTPLFHPKLKTTDTVVDLALLMVAIIFLRTDSHLVADNRDKKKGHIGLRLVSSASTH